MLDAPIVFNKLVFGMYFRELMLTPNVNHVPDTDFFRGGTLRILRTARQETDARDCISTKTVLSVTEA